MNNIVVYTCITNNYDWLLPPLWTSPNVLYICFSDNPNLTCKGWEVLPLPVLPGLGNGNLANRFCKFFPWKILPEHHWSLYVDAHIRLLSDPSPVIADIETSGYHMAIPVHPHRSNIWEEVDACIRFKKFKPEDQLQVQDQLDRYKRDGLVRDSGLTENGIIIRSGNHDVLEPMMQLWWYEFLSGVKRDQISLPYVLSKKRTEIYRLPFSSRDNNPYFRIVPHRNQGSAVNYLAARQYHGLHWSFAFHAYRIASGVLRRLRRGFALVFGYAR